MPTASDDCGPLSVSCSPPGPYGLGETTVTCTANNSVGSTSCSFKITVRDDEPPAITCPANASVDTEPNTCSATVNYSASATDNCGNPTVVCVPASPATLPPGVHTITCTATDAATNSASCSFTVTVRDRQPPEIECPENIVTNTVQNACHAIVNFAPSATDNCMQPPPSVSCTPSSGTIFPKGTTTVSCKATDSSGNESTPCTFTVTVEDDTDPVVNCPSGITAFTPAGQCSAVANFNVSASDNCPEVGEVTCSPQSGHTFPLGVTTVTCMATDASGNMGSCSFDVTVFDNRPPLITCPDNITQNTDPNLCTAVVTFGASATDNCPGVSSPTCIPPSGTAFPKGTSGVTCTAVDASGNSASCSFAVTINDKQAPTITCPANITQSTASGTCSKVVTFSATPADNCPGATYSCNPPSGSTFPKGSTTVTCTPVDTSGNYGTGCSFSVTINDTQKPSITCPGSITRPTAPGQCSAVVTFNVSASDNCPGVTHSCSPPSGSTFGKGTTVVNCTATDASGNTQNCAFTVVVRDEEAPHITCPANIEACGNEWFWAIVVWPPLVVSDNCDLPPPSGPPPTGPPPTTPPPTISVVCSPPSGSYFTVGLNTVHCTATDTAGNSADCDFTVKVKHLELSVPQMVFVNADDDDGNNIGEYDKDNTMNPRGSTVIDPEYLQLFVSASHFQPSDMITITVTRLHADSGHIRIFRKELSGDTYLFHRIIDEQQSSASVTVAQAADKLYIEGVIASSQRDDVQISVSSNGDPCGSFPLLLTVVDLAYVDIEALLSPIMIPPPDGGFGMAIYADKPTPTAGGDFTAVRVVAVIDPPIAGVNVFFTSFDVDDPYEHDEPVDDEFGVNDNRGDEPNGYFTGGANSTAAATDGDGRAIVTFHTTKQPGDNFRIVASPLGDFADQHKAAQKTLWPGAQNPFFPGDLILTYTEPQQLGERIGATTMPQQYRTWMLTVWRRLHIERDSMAAALGNVILTSIRSISGSSAGATRIHVLATLGDGSPDLESLVSFPPFSNHGAQKISKTFWACYGSFFHCSLRR